MQRAYLLETSAFRTLPSQQLAAASQQSRLLVSPFCFWELLKHLEDDGQFSRIKGNLMKFRYVRVLDDPQASVERGVVLPGDEVHDRVDDSDVVYATLAALLDSESVADFYQKYITDSHNQVRQIADCVSRGRAVLETEERRFQDFVNKIMGVFSDRRVCLATPEDRHQRTIAIINGQWLQLDDRALQSDQLRERFARQMYMYCSYVVHQAVKYINCNAPQVNPNDFEDARFCQHLALDAEMTAVTTDLAQRQCLQEVLSLLNGLQDMSWHTALQVWDVGEFVAGFSTQ